MRPIAIAIALSLISTSAVAQPPPPGPPPYPDRYDPYRGPYDRYDRDRYRPYDRDGRPYHGYGPYDGYRYDRRHDQRFSDERWQELLVRPTARPGIQVIVFRGKGGRLGWLRIAPAHGVVRIDIEYADRPPQSAWVEHAIAPGGDALIQVDRSARIREVVIHTRRPGGYAVFGV